MMRARFALLALALAATAHAQTYDTAGRLKTTAQVTNTSATVAPVASRLTDGTGFIVPVLDTTLTARFPAGSTPADDESNAVTITRSGAFMFRFDGAAWDRWTGAVTTSEAHADDSPYGLGDTGSFMLAVREDVPSTLVNLNYDYQAVKSDSVGRLWVNGSGVTQPVSGTVTADAGTGTFATDPADEDTRILGRVKIHDGTDSALVSGTGSLQVTCDNCGGSTFQDDDAFVGGTTPVVPIAAVYDNTPPTITDGDAGTPRMSSTRILLVDGSGATQPVSGTVTVGVFPDNEPFNLAQVNGATVQVGNGTAAGAQRVTIASDGTGQLSTVTTVGTVTNLTNLPNEGQQTAANSISVTPDTDNDAIAAAGSAPPEYMAVAGLSSGATGGLIQGLTVCDSFANVNVSTATTTLIVTGVSGRHVRICSLSLVTAAANNVAFISGTGATCGTGTTAMNGGTTAAAGWNFAANGGLTQGSGIGAINQTNAAGDSVCVVTSAATQLSGRLSYTIY